jgi:lipopolysaccharide transport protein LptA
MIEYLVMAFFVGQPVQAAPVAPGGGSRAPTQAENLQLRNPVEITSKRVSGTRGQAVFSGDVLVKHRTLQLRCDEMIAHSDGPREVTRVECVGNVRAVDGDRTARGERADFDVPTGVLVVTGKPEARDPSTYLRGSEVRMMLGNSNFEVKDAVVTLESAPLKVKTSQSRNPVEISARRVSGTRGQTVFTGDVLVKHRTLDLRCDKMIAHSNGPREVTRGECVGNVRAVDGERTARGERADFDVPTGVLVVTGNPEARDPTTHIRGSEVRMTLGNSNFEVKDAVVTLETAPLKDKKRRDTAGNTEGTRQP